ncbi:MAG: ribonuclease J [Candidatus Paceibacterota bacterium]
MPNNEKRKTPLVSSRTSKNTHPSPRGVQGRPISGRKSSQQKQTPTHAKKAVKKRSGYSKRHTTRFSLPALPQGASNNTAKSSKHIKPPEKDTVRIVILGGVEEIGKNMLAIEYNDEILVIDCGIQFKEQETPGIDFILPNTKYLEERKEKIKGLLITHGHLDHIGGIPYILNKIGNPAIYTRNLTALMIKKRQEEFPTLAPLTINVVEKDDTISIGSFPVAFFAVTHTIPDAMGIIVKTPYGNIVHTGDLKLDHVDGVPTQQEEEEFSKFKDEDVLLLMADSTNVERPGFSIPESKVNESIDEIIKNIKGRLIIGTFASQIERVTHIIEIAEKYGRKVIIDGRSMKTNVEIAKLAGVLKPKKDTLIPIEEMNNYPPHKLIALVTGAQGDEFAVLMRIANQNHKHFKINNTDTVLLSSSIVPGNERSVQKLKDNLSRQGAKIIHYQVSDVHSSGHANREETKWIHRHIGARFFIPLHGYHYMLRVHTEVAREVGIPQENMTIPDNSMLIEIKDGKEMSVNKDRAPGGLMLVDGLSIGDIQEVVIRDRQMLAQDGMFVIIITLDTVSGKVRKSPDIISRGFVYLRESQDLLKEARGLVKKTVEKNTGKTRPINFDFIKNELTEEISKFLLRKTHKHPIVIPVILGT